MDDIRSGDDGGCDRQRVARLWQAGEQPSIACHEQKPRQRGNWPPVRIDPLAGVLLGSPVGNRRQVVMDRTVWPLCSRRFTKGSA